jgi:2-aminoethylphosphonate-pyruvate transaminase
VTSSNKCIEGVPGFSIVLADKAALSRTDGFARSVSLDLRAQWKGLDKNGQFRFTPPVHSLLAFRQALVELDQEGGVVGRMQRYRANYGTLVTGMQTLGFRAYLAPDKQGYIITAFHYPAHPNFDFDTFYQLLSDRGFVIYPGKLSEANCFRIGTIGRLYPTHIKDLLGAIEAVLRIMNVTLT